MAAYTVAMQQNKKKTKKFRSNKGLNPGSEEEDDDNDGEDSVDDEDNDKDSSEQGQYVLIYRPPKRGAKRLKR